MNDKNKIRGVAKKVKIRGEVKKVGKKRFLKNLSV